MKTFNQLYIILFIIATILSLTYFIAPLLIPSIIGMMQNFIPIEIQNTYPASEMSRIKLNLDQVRVVFNADIDKYGILINPKITMKKESSKENVKGELKIIDNNLIYMPFTDLQEFTKYTVKISYQVKDIFGNVSNNTKTLYFISGFTPSENRPFYNKFNITNEINNTRIKTIHGLNSSDKIYGSNRSDIIFGNNGNDTIYGGDNNDAIVGGLGSDYISGRNGNDYIHTGTNSSEQIKERSIDKVNAGDGDDLVFSDGYDLIDCGLGNDNVNYINTSKYVNCETKSLSQN